MAARPTDDWDDDGLNLNPKQRRFVEEYLIDLNATQAATRAGYSPATANEQGARLLAHASVKEAIRRGQAARSERTQITQDMVLRELAKIGFSDIRRAVKWRSSLVTEEDQPDGGDVLVVKTIVSNTVELIASEDLDDDTAAAISEISQNATGGVKMKMYDKKGALVDIGRHLGMFVERHELSGKDGGAMKVEMDAERFTSAIASLIAREGEAEGDR